MLSKIANRSVVRNVEVLLFMSIEMLLPIQQNSTASRLLFREIPFYHV